MAKVIEITNRIRQEICKMDLIDFMLPVKPESAHINDQHLSIIHNRIMVIYVFVSRCLDGGLRRLNHES